jgi:hypothetical protein
LTVLAVAATLRKRVNDMVITEAWEGLKRDGRAVDRVIAALAAKVGNRLVTSQAVREQHGNTLTWIAGRGGVSTEHRRRARGRAPVRQ